MTTMTERLQAEVDAYRADNRELVRTLREVLDVVIWMSGSSDFSPEGQGGQAWARSRDKVIHPALNLVGGVSEGTTEEASR